MKRVYPDSSCVSTMDSQYDMFLIGNSINIGIKTSEPHVEFVYSDVDSVNILLSLNLKQFDQLVKYMPMLKSSLKKRPETTETLCEYETLLQQQTQFLIGNNIYVTVNHLRDESQLQFIEYIVVPSSTVPGQRVVCPARLCMCLDMTQLQELSSQVCLIKTAIKKVKKKKPSAPSNKLCDALPDYATCLLTSSQKKSEGVTETEEVDSVTSV